MLQLKDLESLTKNIDEVLANLTTEAVDKWFEEYENEEFLLDVVVCDYADGTLDNSTFKTVGTKLIKNKVEDTVDYSDYKNAMAA